MIMNTLATLKMVDLLEKLKKAQDLDDALFLSSNVDLIISEWEKLKDLDPDIMVVYEAYKEEGFNFDSEIR